MSSALTRSSIHRAASNKTALDQLVRVTAHDLSIFAGARLAFVSVDNEVSRSALTRFLPSRLVHYEKRENA